MKITFKQDSMRPQTKKILVDDKDITEIVRDIKICAKAGDITTVFLKLYPSEIEIDSHEVKLTEDHFTIEDMLQALSQKATIYATNRNIAEIKENIRGTTDDKKTRGLL